jgi:ribosomal protein L11 methyltransferase
MSSYYRVRLFNVPSAQEDEVTRHAMKCGANGLSEALVYTQSNLTYEPTIIHKRNHDVDVFFAEHPAQDFFTGLTALLPQQQWEIQQEEHKDWLAEWKKGFVPFQLAGPYWVVPTWIPSPVPPEHTILIDPGMAFGTGTHATTKMASYFVQKITQQLKKEKHSALSMIDVGTGTGILAMLAAKQGIDKVVGLEIDPEARRVARENILLNDIAEVSVPDTQLEDLKERFDLVVANIIDGVLVQIREPLLKVLKPGGHLFLTGILLEREETFFQQFIDKSALTVVRRLEQDEWVGVWVQHGDA